MIKTDATVLIIFGVTGDLMAKKIAGSIFHLYIKNELPKNFKVVGFARRDISQEDFKKYIMSITKKSSHIQSTDKIIEKFSQLFYYQQGNFYSKKDYKNLGILIDGLGVNINKLFYLAVPPVLYENIFENLSQSKIARENIDSWSRIIVEKPFGSNFKTAEMLDEQLGKLFKESQIYRIDHYLGKEILQNILAFRFSNNLLEHSWDKNLIEKIEVRLYEKDGVGERADTYDSIGALKDVGQNHILQMLSLVTMENPNTFSAQTVRDNRSKILLSLKKLNKTEIKSKTIRSQYTGYTKHDGVNKNSQTETYFKITGELTGKRWKGVSLILESGKKMPELRKEIIITFKHPQPCMCSDGNKHYQNKIIFTLEPKEEIKIVFWAKKPGLEMKIQERSFDFGYRNSNNQEYAAEYEKLFLDCINGDQTLFVSTQEVKAMWKFIDPIIREWSKNSTPLTTYTPGSLPQ